MYSLIMTVQSISLLADLHQIRFEQYKKEIEPSLEHDGDYNIPSLIWPPPKQIVPQYIIPSVLPPPPLLFLIQIKGGSTWLQQ